LSAGELMGVFHSRHFAQTNVLKQVFNNLPGFGFIAYQFVETNRLRMMSKIFIRGFIDVYGFWNTICI
jgi:hypothetical protein